MYSQEEDAAAGTPKQTYPCYYYPAAGRVKLPNGHIITRPMGDEPDEEGGVPEINPEWVKLLQQLEAKAPEPEVVEKAEGEEDEEEEAEKEEEEAEEGEDFEASARAEARADAAAAVLLLVKEEENRVPLVEAGLLPMLKLVLEESSGECQMDALRTLWWLKTSEDTAVPMAEAGIVQPVAAIMNRKAGAADSSPTTVAAPEPEPEDTKKAKKKSKKQLELERQQEEEAAEKEAASANLLVEAHAKSLDVLVKMTYFEKTRVKMNEMGAVQGLLPILAQQENPAERAEACTAIDNLSSPMSFRVSIANLGVVPMLVAILQDAEESTRIKAKAQHTLANLCEPFENRTLLLKEKLLQQLLGVVQQDRDLTSRSRAEALRGLSALATHGLKCRKLKQQLDKDNVFAVVRGCIM